MEGGGNRAQLVGHRCRRTADPVAVGGDHHRLVLPSSTASRVCSINAGHAGRRTSRYRRCPAHQGVERRAATRAGQVGMNTSVSPRRQHASTEPTVIGRLAVPIRPRHQVRRRSPYRSLATPIPAVPAPGARRRSLLDDAAGRRRLAGSVAVRVRVAVGGTIFVSGPAGVARPVVLTAPWYFRQRLSRGYAGSARRRTVSATVDQRDAPTSRAAVLSIRRSASMTTYEAPPDVRQFKIQQIR